MQQPGHVRFFVLGIAVFVAVGIAIVVGYHLNSGSVIRDPAQLEANWKELLRQRVEMRGRAIDVWVANNTTTGIRLAAIWGNWPLDITTGELVAHIAPPDPSIVEGDCYVVRGIVVGESRMAPRVNADSVKRVPCDQVYPVYP